MAPPQPTKLRVDIETAEEASCEPWDDHRRHA